MDNKSWPWRKKSTEKIIVANDTSVKGNEEEMQTLLAEKAELEKDLNTLNDKLSAVLSDCENKDELVKQHAKMAQEAVKGWEKAEAEAASLKIQLDESLRHQIIGEERVAHLNGALKECMQQLRYNRDEQEQRIHDAIMKTSKGFEKSQMALEEKLAETNKKLGKISSENVHLNKALALKENLIEELNAQLNQVEVDFNALMSRLESTEKDNSSLKYEVRVLGKELEIRNEEREFNCRTADASHKQNLESVKKIAKLESECQRLRLLVRKRLPGPAALAKMKNEVEMLGRDPVEMRRKTNPSSLLFDSVADNSFETLSKKISVLTEQLFALEEENKTLKLVLTKKTNELQFSRNMYARTASKLSQVESRLDDSPKFRKVVDPTSSPMSHEFSYASMSDIGSDDKVSNAESWASALVSELEHFRNERQKGSLSSKTARGSDINLMDDFLEMEKLAVVSVDKPVGGSHASSNDTNAIVGPLETESTSELIGSEIVPISDNESSFSVSNLDIRFIELSNGKIPVWLQDIGNLIMEQNRLTGKKIEEMLEDIRAVLVHRKLPKPQAPKPPPVSSNNSPSNKSTLMDLSGGETEIDISLVENNKQLQAGSTSCIHNMIQLIEGIGLPSPDFCQAENAMCKENLFPYKSLEAPAGYMVRVFQWKTSELTAVLQKYVHACYELLNGKADLNKFAQELTSALDWIINHCFSIQDVSCMRDAIRKQFDWDDSRSESEAEAGMMGHFPKTEKTHVSRESFLCFPSATASNGRSIYPEEMKYTVAEENKRLNNEMMNIEYAKKEMEEKPQSATDRSEYLINQLHESEKIIASLQTELHTLKQSKGIIEDEVENQKIISEDLDTQLSVARVELNETCQKFSSLEVELENKNNHFEELEATCVELQLQLESMKKESSKSYNQEEKQLRSDWEITAASEKLVECQQTIVDLGKQLKALAAPREEALFDKVITESSDTNTTNFTSKPTRDKDKNANHRSSLLDQMLAEDGEAVKGLKSPDTKEVDSTSTTKLGPKKVTEPLEKILGLNDMHQDDNASVDSLAIVPSKKQRSNSLWRRLLWKKRGNRKKTPLSLAS